MDEKELPWKAEACHACHAARLAEEVYGQHALVRDAIRVPPFPERQGVRGQRRSGHG